MSGKQNLAAITITPAIGSLSAYISKINQIPLLTLEEEQDLATRFRASGDLEAAKRLVMSHLRFVSKIARGYVGYGLAVGDLIQEGNIGLMKAVKRFDPQMGVRLVSFAVHWIKAEMHEFILKNWRIVKIATTKAQRKLFFNLRKADKQLSWFSPEETKAVATHLKVTTSDVDLMEKRLCVYDESFNGYSADDDMAAALAPEEYLEDNRYNPALQAENNDWTAKRENSLQQAMSLLDQRSQDVLVQRWLVDEDEKATLHDLAAKYSVSAERIRQIEKAGMDKIKKILGDEL
ncbi:MAG: rpoH [Gammaproteobacteria bacterium]|nr:rpoH [Gammaproteobacteria bacterium]